MATIQDVARRAGVSTATASRVISGRGYVSPASRDQVLAAAGELGYVPNGLVRGLKTRRSGLVALLVPEIVNSFYTTDEDAAKERAYVELLVSTRVDGAVLLREYDGTIGLDWSWQAADGCIVRAPFGNKGARARRRPPAATRRIGANPAPSAPC